MHLLMKYARKASTSNNKRPFMFTMNRIVVGEYFADLLVENRVLVELKAAKAFDEVHMAQCLNYLKATGLPVCLLINFGIPRIQIKRLVM